MYNIYTLLESQTGRYPDKPALLFEEKCVTYREFYQLVNRTAYSLYHYGIDKGAKVAVLFYNGIRFLSVFYALQKLGAIAVLLNYRYNMQEIQAALAASDSKFLVLDEMFIEEKHLRQPFTSNTKTISYAPSLWADIPNLSETFSAGQNDWSYYAAPEADAPAIFVFSGGTTSAPKIIVSSQQSLVYSALLHNITDDGYGVYSSDTIALFLPLYHTGGLQYAITFLSMGATILLMRKYNQEELLAAIPKHQITHVFFIPANLCSQVAESPYYQKGKMGSVRNVILGGSVVTESIIQSAFELFPHAMLTLGYGCSEGFSTALCLTQEAYRKNPSLGNSVGYPTLMSQIRLLDDMGAEVPSGGLGEAVGRSPWMMNGYYQNHQIVKAPEWIFSGDILRKDDQGRYYFCDRKKDIVRTAGENVSTFEIENVLAKHGAVRECAVFGVKHDRMNEIIVAAVVLEPGAQQSEEELISFCKEHVASYKKPKKILFLDALPRTSVGKVDKKLLRQQYQHVGDLVR